MKTYIKVIITVIVLSLSRNASFAQAPNLGAADSFVLFTTTGSFTVTGASDVTGNIGSNAGSFTGFPPGTLTGRIYLVDSTSAKVAVAIDNAYAYLDAMSCGTVIGTTLGSNQVLIPGVYCLGGSSTLNGNLILDGQGDPNAIFIFKINGALSTATFSNILLIDSASLCNVYWQINGAFDLGDSSVFRGTILANGAISLLGNSSLEGRGLTRQGAVSLDSNNVIICTQFLVPMPVNLLSFTAEKSLNNKGIDLRWSTTPGGLCYNFNIERSVDGRRYKVIGKQIAIANTGDVNYYFFNDGFPEGNINFYRLDLFEVDGTHSYSNVKVVHFSTTIFSAEIYPNPFTSTVNILLNDASESNSCEFYLYNIFGTEVMHNKIVKESSCFAMEALPSGIYYYKIICNDDTFRSGKLIAR